MKDKLIVGYDLGDRYSQISYWTNEGTEPETLSMVAGGESYNIPTLLCKRQGVSQWFFGKDARKRAGQDDSFLIRDLVSLARAGEPVKVEEEEFDPTALLTLFVKRSMALLTATCGTDRMEGLMITCEKLDGRMVEILNEVVSRLDLKAGHIYFQGHVESFYYYTIHQPKELWSRQVMVFDRRGDEVCVYRLECNRRTTPVVAFVDEETYPLPDPGKTVEELTPDESGRMDEQFLEILKTSCEGRLISSAYLIGEGFDEEWMKESLRYLCRGRRVFQGNNLYSKGACFAMREKLSASDVGRTHVFLGNEKLKANVGMRLLRQGEESYYALLDAGQSWFDVHAELDFMLVEENTFSLIVTPLNGRNVKHATVTLDGLSIRKGAASRLHMEMHMSSETCIEMEIEDRGFGEIFPASYQKWTESFEVE